ncbi:5-carboxymethyl-2-hydroxymuconate Delta-isomerase [Pseudoalteromonas sp. S16_S37]|uniref:5-carboxymethyl-2-hydroxymuconate Delta-isomerase n=1 Tax=Pseudoalteromonas sp. S16_S37 TaxID=2720228 RepID=UPI00167FF691|nr:5-carboxymethyl-2-hydroxymuconate isomerase [Pseudoalteromonas sp. S16_S37]MBD1580798.1 5-carboxymethyl-2-hydroxymuconate isomerase [Pseudoalteromonas sp. S16_S37]
MPHIIIEHACNLPVSSTDLVECVHQAVEQTNLFDNSTIKTRSQSFEHFKVQTGKIGFVHVQAHLIAGRSDEQKQLLSDTILSALKTLLDSNWLLSVHPYDLIPGVYRKN